MSSEVSTPVIVEAIVDATHIRVVLDDGRVIATPLTWYPSLLKVGQAAIQDFVVSPFGLHWPKIDEDLSVRGMLAGARSVSDGPPLSPVSAHSMTVSPDFNAIALDNGRVDIEWMEGCE